MKLLVVLIKTNQYKFNFHILIPLHKESCRIDAIKDTFSNSPVQWNEIKPVILCGLR